MWKRRQPLSLAGVVWAPWERDLKMGRCLWYLDFNSDWSQIRGTLYADMDYMQGSQPNSKPHQHRVPPAIVQLWRWNGNHIFKIGITQRQYTFPWWSWTISMRGQVWQWNVVRYTDFSRQCLSDLVSYGYRFEVISPEGGCFLCFPKACTRRRGVFPPYES